MNNEEKIKKNIENFGNQKIKYRKITYKRGRPKKNDYIILQVKDIYDYIIFERLENAFKSHYTKNLT